MKRLLLATAVFLCSLMAWTAGATLPSDALLEKLKPQGAVNDFAGILNAQEHAALEQQLVALKQTTGAEVAIVTIASLEGGNDFDFAVKLFTKWGVGKKGKDNGLLLLVAMQEHKARIVTGYGLEPIIPDAVAGRIITEQLVPSFHQKKFAEGLIRAADAIIERIQRGEPAAAAERGPRSSSAQEQLFKWIFLVIWGLIFFSPIWLFVLAKMLGKNKGRILGIPYDMRGGIGRTTWNWGGGGYSGGFSSSGGGGGFGGGSTGGGGAGGSW